MSTHTTSATRRTNRSRGGGTGPTGTRCDERGIALQTVIIMVVMLAIAGGVAAVLLSRGSQTTAQLEAQGVSAVVATNINSPTLCNATSGVVWDPATTATGNRCEYRNTAACEAAGGTTDGDPNDPCNDKDGNLLGYVNA